ncbi:hypothetical protein [Actinokineospora inagensis]|uniref:hypothetical protein n=1 Tax=Actinokineospora inagensis TaxID=103730 RepID=UPI00047C23A5|nr:hypothetical protein [Actinokineospora inagensis]
MTTDQAWRRCLRRRSRLCGSVARFGLPDHADDIVHDVFIAVMTMPRLYPRGFDSLLDMAVWRRCQAVAIIEAGQQRLGRVATLQPEHPGDPADSVLDQVSAASVLRDCGALGEPDIWMIDMISRGYQKKEVAHLAERSLNDVDRTVRAIRRRSRDKMTKSVGRESKHA